MLPRKEALLGQAILRKYVRPVGEKAGIQKCIGWHTFRHTFSTLLRSVGTEFKVMQELLRHSTLRSTLDVYTQAITPARPLLLIVEKQSRMPTRTRSGLHPVTPKKLFASSLACSIRFHIGEMNLAVGYQLVEVLHQHLFAKRRQFGKDAS